jgi:hypothetical protein
MKNIYKIPTIKFKFEHGDYVRNVAPKSIFEKGATVGWSSEIYIIYQVNLTDPPTYKIKNLEDEPIVGSFYTEELKIVSFQEFPYDTFKVVKEKANQALVVKLNSENCVWCFHIDLFLHAD